MSNSFFITSWLFSKFKEMWANGAFESVFWLIWTIFILLCDVQPHKSFGHLMDVKCLLTLVAITVSLRTISICIWIFSWVRPVRRKVGSHKHPKFVNRDNNTSPGTTDNESHVSDYVSLSGYLIDVPRQTWYRNTRMSYICPGAPVKWQNCGWQDQERGDSTIDRPRVR